MTVYININLDAKCKRCGKPGPVNKTGLCMSCIADDIRDGKFDHIINKYRPGQIKQK
jgi:hypothetical protein